MKKFFFYPLLLSLLASTTLSTTSCCQKNDEQPQPAPVVVAEDSLFYPTADSLATTYDPKKQLTESLRDSIFVLYNKHSWATLEQLFADSINYGWPPAFGGYDTYTVTLKKGEVFDRFQSSLDTTKKVSGKPMLTGTFFSPIINGDTVPYAKRALRDPKSAAALYYTVEVLEDLTFKAQDATIIPWFGQPGEGTQSNWNIPKSGAYPITLTQLALDGKIKITIVDSPNGKFDYLEGKTIP